MNNKTGQFIYELRNEKGLTQKQLAEKLFVTDKAISKWETGKGMPDSSMLMPLSKALGVSTNEILNGERIAEDDFAIESHNATIEPIQVSQKRPIEIAIGLISIIIAILLIYALQIPVNMVKEYMSRTLQVIKGYLIICTINFFRGIPIGVIVYGLAKLASISNQLRDIITLKIKTWQKWVMLAIITYLAAPVILVLKLISPSYIMITLTLQTCIVCQHLLGVYIYLMLFCHITKKRKKL